ncbi:hypothetical protein D915_004209 [Fasciola hepatica]|uniref:Uncharacterized protein n=1 Tax=Fasciola hepatica TaxID=6192 RepID=A0A4E0RTM6_FASHE|nr:hypothetical protein D915_004209 [Fasciola hepatica]
MMRTSCFVISILSLILTVMVWQTEQALIRPGDLRLRRAYLSPDLDLDNLLDFGIALGTRRLNVDQPDEEPRLRGSVMRYGK